jgi:tRNA (guanine37-N1)-methyltransferase
MMHIGIITLFPDMFQLLNWGVTSRALTLNIVHMTIVDLRQFSVNGRVDDAPFGGGGGMVLSYVPLAGAITHLKKLIHDPWIIYMSPAGAPLKQAMFAELCQRNLIILCGRYEGIDERIIEQYVDQEISTGDYVVSGGEIPALLLLDGMLRLLPQILHNPSSLQQESFSDQLLNYPQYTRPESIDDRVVPAILRSGNHQAIAQWRMQQRIMRTQLRRKDLKD